MKQTDLFDQNNGAIFSECRNYRYALWRIWDKDVKLVMFIGLNPSTANESRNDPTIHKVKKFAFNWGYGGFYMMNLFAYITSYPDELKKYSSFLNQGINLTINDDIEYEDEWLRKTALKCDKIIFAWGSFKEATERAKVVMKMFTGYALEINKDGSPRHPLYVKSNIEPVKYLG